MMSAAALAALVLGAVAAEAQTRSLPMYEVDKAWPKVPPRYIVGDPSSFAIDAEDHVWLLHRPRTLLKPEQAKMAAPPIVVFDTAGNFVRAWGGEGAGYQWVEREHGIHIDHQGFVWVTGNNCPTNGIENLRPVADDQILKFTQQGKFLLQIGRTSESKGNADTRNLHRPADVQVYAATNELFVADGYGNRRVAVFDATTGAFKRMWGAFGAAPTDEDNCMVTSPTAFPAGRGPAQFNIVHALRVAKDGTVYVADRENRRVQVFTSQGRFVNQIYKADTPFARNLALSPDQQWLYVGDGKEIAIVHRTSLEIVGAINAPGMIGAGHQIATDSKGNIYVAGTGAGMQKLTFRGMGAAATR
jgi:DNA-binding beta-propeller fold protein YncE